MPVRPLGLRTGPQVETGMLRSPPYGIASDPFWRYGKALVSINLAHWFAEVIDILGFSGHRSTRISWLRLAVHYADHSSRALAAHDRQITDLGQQYDGQSHAALAAAWSNQSHGNTERLIQPTESSP